MHLVMFDIDGTLLESSEFDADCYVAAVKQVLGLTVSGDWSTYRHVSDTGVLDELIQRHGLSAAYATIHRDVKQAFLQQIAAHLAASPAKQLPGAAAFLDYLSRQDGVFISIATGGWLESSRLKLRSAGIDVTDIPIASSNDHFIRTEIMKAAESRAGAVEFESKTYFGDGAWDKLAAEQLRYNFVLVGENQHCQVDHHQYLSDFTAVEKALGYIGL